MTADNARAGGATLPEDEAEWVDAALVAGSSLELEPGYWQRKDWPEGGVEIMHAASHPEAPRKHTFAPFTCACGQERARTRAHARKHTRTHAQPIHPRTRPHTRTHTHTPTHARSHRHTHTHTHIYSFWILNSPA